MSDTKRIGWIGAGKMGFPISVRFKQAGHKVTALARSAEARDKLTAAGLNSAATVAEVAHNSDIVFSSLSDDTALRSVAAELSSTMHNGATFIDISTVSPTVSAEIAAAFAKHHITYLRSPVSGSTAMATSGTLTAVISGPVQAYDSLAPIFAVFAKKTFHVGEAEEARAMKLVLNSMVAATSALLSEALAFGAKGGLDIATMLNVVNQSVVASPLIAYKTDMIVKGDYTPAATLSMLQKDVDLFLTTGTNQKLKLPLASMVHAIYQKAAHDGLGERDFFVLIQDALKHSG